jgi:alpha-glucosidase
MLPLTASIHPEVASLPIFVRAGAILPIAPLTQSTNEVPQGPLTLRVYAGSDCAGRFYLDDGKTYAYEKGASLRMEFTCEISPDSLRIRVGEHKGSFPAWWRQISVEIYGWSPRKNTARVDGSRMVLPKKTSAGKLTLTIPDSGRGLLLELE